MNFAELIESSVAPTQNVETPKTDQKEQVMVTKGQDSIPQALNGGYVGQLIFNG